MSRQMSIARFLSLALTTTLAVSLLPFAPGVATAAPVNGTALLNEDFGGATVTNPAIRALDDACLTRSTTQPPATDPSVSNLGKCHHTTNSPGPGVDPGYLQLTDNANNRRGGMVYNQALPGNAGIQVEFQQFQYGTERAGADGITFFLVDGSLNLASTGAYGGSLGYAQRNNEPGVLGGYLGVGLDVFGNYANDGESRGRGCAPGDRSPVPGSRQIPNSVVIRGPQASGDPSGRTGYCYLDGTLNSSASRTTLPGSLRGPTIPRNSSAVPNGARRDVRITVSEDRFPTVTVEIDFLDGRGYRNVLNYRMTTPAPATWKFGLASSTGGNRDVHLIRTIKVQTVVPLNAINLVKQVDRTQQQPATYAVGDTIPYQFVVTNAEANALSNVAVSDPRIANTSCPRTTLDPAGFPGATMTCTGTYTVQPGDAAGRTTLTNTALVKATTTTGGTVQDTDTVTVDLTPTPDLTISKTAALNDANGNNVADVGETVDYSFAVTNTGNVTITGIAVQDPSLSGLACDAVSLDPGDATACHAAGYTVTQADVDGGVPLHNSATVTGRPPTGSTITRGPSTTDVPVPAANPKLQLVKTPHLSDTNANGAADPGETVSYDFTLTNLGNVTLGAVVVSDPKVPGITCPASTLAPGASTTCTGPAYTVTQADSDAGVVANTATGTGTPPSGTPVTARGDSSVPTRPALPKLTLEKTPTVHDTNGNGITDVGDTVDYGFLVANRGNVTITGISVVDAKVGTVTCPQSILAPQEAMTCTATGYVITAADGASGAADNTAGAIGTPPGGGNVTAFGTSRVPVQQPAPQITLAKLAHLNDTNSNGLADLGETIDYSFGVRNTGNVTLTGVTVDDPKAGPATCQATTLLPGASTACTAATYTVTQSDLDAGSVQNTATATGTPPGTTTPVPSQPSSTTVPALKPNPGLALTKTASLNDTNGNHLADLGETIDYGFRIRNTGNVSQSAVGVTDAKVGPVTCPAGDLAPQQNIDCVAVTYSVTQADVDAGAVDNSATAVGTPPGGGTTTSPPATTRTPTATADPGLALGKTATLHDTNGDGLAELGETITYSFTVRNTGNVTIAGITVDDPKAGTATCSATPLPPGQTMDCTAADYTVTQDDVDAGQVANSATAGGTPPGGGTVKSPPAHHVVPVKTPQPALTLAKAADLNDTNGDGLAQPGETVRYTFVATNAGDVTLTSLSITDDRAGSVTCTPTTIAPGATAACAADAPYTVTQADVNAGVVANEAYATAQPPGNTDPVESNHPHANVPVEAPDPQLTIAKTGQIIDDDGNGLADVGEHIDYGFTVTNVGNVTMTGVGVDDAMLGPVACTPATLAPGAHADCAAAPYTVQQADIDRGYVGNSATAHGTPPTGPNVPSQPSIVIIPAETPQPLLTLSKTATLVNDTNGIADLGDHIRYTFTVTNGGNVTMSDLQVHDATAGPVTCDATVLAPGVSTSCQADAEYVVTQADVDTGRVENVARADSRTPGDLLVPSNLARTALGTTLPAPGLFVAKTAALNDLNGNGTADVAETIGYSFEVRNTGTVTLTGVAIVDPVAGSATCAATTLAPAETTICTADAPRPVTQDDLDAGRVRNTATATGVPPGGGTVPSRPSTTEVKTTPSAPGLVVVKTPALNDANGNHVADVGETISYGFTITNTGNVTLTAVAVDDPTAGSVTCAATTLPPGAFTTCTADTAHTVTQADVDHGSVDNTARPTGTTPDGGLFTGPPSKSAVPTARSAPGLTVTKGHTLTDSNGNGTADAGERITYGFVVTNTGNVTITGVAVDDPKAGAATCSPTTLAPGAQSTCTADADYVVTQVDVDHGFVANTATATGTPPTGPDTTSPPVTHNVPTTPARPGITVVKTATLVDGNANFVADAGETIEYSFVLTNTGNITLDPVGVDDPSAGTVTCVAMSLAPGASTTCTAPDHTVTQADVDLGYVENTATGTGTTPGGTPITSPPDTRRVPTVQPLPGITLVKHAVLIDDSGGTPGLADVGETVSYSFTVTNTGNVSLTGVGVSDPKVGPVTCAQAGLAPGESTTCSAADYTVTQADVDAGTVANTATGTGTPPTGRPPTSTSTVHVPAVPQKPLLAVQKTAALHDGNGNSLGDVGETISYAFTITNTGNVTLTGVQVNDALAGAVTCAVSILAPGEFTSCASADYTITQSDVDRGFVENSATATGVPPSGTRTPPSLPGVTTTATVSPVPGLALVKTATLTDTNGNGVADIGEQVAYTLSVTNTGNVTLTGIAVDDAKLAGVTCPSGPLAPAATIDCTGSYTVTQADIDAGAVANSATATGTPPTGPRTTSPPGTSLVPTPVQDPRLHVVKTAQLDDADGNGWADLGETVRYAFVVTNTGNVTLTGVGVDDPKLGAVPCVAATLAPGESTDCGPATYTVTQADIDAGYVHNSATGGGNPPIGPRVPSLPSTTDIPALQRTTGLAIIKLAQLNDTNGNRRGDAGETITYAFLVWNTGNVTMTDVAVDDVLAAAVTCPQTTLGPYRAGSVMVCSADADHLITTADVRRGSVVNTATATGRTPGGTMLTSTPSTTTTPTRPGLARTGGDPWLLVSLGFVMVLAGAALVRSRGRRRRGVNS
ncbi:hypothetical protein PROP_01254 [Propionicimonas sp. T2.31MG-18]|uniref:DUF7507 domain-containing protein n=1 Tax=Propionicimonas sp. T2.31MG-18 TaxID=3157620 RepID=UPI0035E8EB46